jgi:hypothetical protein
MYSNKKNVILAAMTGKKMFGCNERVGRVKLSCCYLRHKRANETERDTLYRMSDWLTLLVVCVCVCLKVRVRVVASVCGSAGL